MKIALVRHVAVGSVDTMGQVYEQVYELVQPVANQLRELGYFGRDVGLFCSTSPYPKITSEILAEMNNYEGPIEKGFLRNGASDEEKEELRALVRTSPSSFLHYTGRVVLVTHEPVITFLTGKQRIMEGEIIEL